MPASRSGEKQRLYLAWLANLTPREPYLSGLRLGILVALPVLGWLILSANGKPVTLLGGLQMPLLPMTPNRESTLLFKEIHETAATVGYGLVALHSAAALVHHYFQRDNTLLRMLPKRG